MRLLFVFAAINNQQLDCLDVQRLTAQLGVAVRCSWKNHPPTSSVSLASRDGVATFSGRCFLSTIIILLYTIVTIIFSFCTSHDSNLTLDDEAQGFPIVWSCVKIMGIWYNEGMNGL